MPDRVVRNEVWAKTGASKTAHTLFRKAKRGGISDRQPEYRRAAIVYRSFMIYVQSSGGADPSGAFKHLFTGGRRQVEAKNRSPRSVLRN